MTIRAKTDLEPMTKVIYAQVHQFMNTLWRSPLTAGGLNLHWDNVRAYIFGEGVCQ